MNRVSLRESELVVRVLFKVKTALRNERGRQDYLMDDWSADLTADTTKRIELYMTVRKQITAMLAHKLTVLQGGVITSPCGPCRSPIFSICAVPPP